MKFNKVLILFCLALSLLALVLISESGRVLGVRDNEIIATRYFDFDQASFDSSPVRLRTICFLTTWDEYCTKADENIRSSQKKIPEDHVVFKADFDTAVDLKRQYGLNIKHECVVIDRTGEVIKRSAPENILMTLKSL